MGAVLMGSAFAIGYKATMLLEIVFVVVMLLWLLSLLPGAGARYALASAWLPWIAVAIVGFILLGHHALG